jgi:hypothetical protein
MTCTVSRDIQEIDDLVSRVDRINPFLSQNNAAQHPFVNVGDAQEVGPIERTKVMEKNSVPTPDQSSKRQRTGET